MIDVVIDLICECGVVGLSVDVICKWVGIVKIVVYWYFGSKDELFMVVS